MRTSTKVGMAVVTGAVIIWAIRRPKIKTIAVDQATKTVQYYMAINGKSIKDTFQVGDTPQIIAAGDGTHYFLAQGNPYLDTVILSICFKKDGGYMATNSLIISL